jgi:aldehyde:ferredoxin oxidoreductase
LDVFSATTGKEVTDDDIIRSRGHVINFQRLFNLRLGYGTREHDRIPYRSQGPVLGTGYESRKSAYDKQLKKKQDLIRKERPQRKMAVLREFKEREYQLLMDAHISRRGWTPNGFPTVEQPKG